ncbi:MAG: response regulator SirA [Peptococcaceae bacterium]|jgi:TusA-related sulfurtransferase|nr:response regulator SirA [Peptococcaceae bacterium]
MKELDCLGEICPTPIIRLKQAMKTSGSGSKIKLITDHSCVQQSILDFLQKTNHKIEINEVINGVWEIVVTKS